MFGIFFHQGTLVGKPAKAKLTTSDPDGDDGEIIHNVILKSFVQGWYVRYVRITMSTGEEFDCPFRDWIGNKAPSSLTVSCRSSGDF